MLNRLKLNRMISNRLMANRLMANRLRLRTIRSLIVATSCGAMVVLASSLSMRASADAKGALPAGAGSLKQVHSAQSPTVYTPATLENHIDGEAQAVKEYNFKACAYAEYAPNGAGNQLLTVDIYDMGSPEDAYGYYSHQRSSDAKLVKIGGEGYVEPTALNFWKGQYYVKLAITATNPAPFQADMPKIAAAVAAKLTGSTSTPAIMSLLPPGAKAHSDQYQRSDIAGQSYINNGVTAKYPAAGQRAELFIAIYTTPGAAKAAYAKYAAYLSLPTSAKAGQKAAEIKGLGESAIGVRSKYAGEVVAALKGKYLIGVRQATTQAAAQSIVKAAVSHAK